MHRLDRLLRFIAIGLLIWLGRPKQAPPLPPIPPPRKGFVDRFRIFEVIQTVASIATVIALVFAFLAVREAQKQVAISTEAIRVSRGQVQPTFQWNTRSDVDLSGAPPARRELILTMYGGAERIQVQATTLLAFAVGSATDLHVASTVSWWEQAQSGAGQVVVLRSKPSSLKQFLAQQDRTVTGLTYRPPWSTFTFHFLSPLYIGTDITVTYLDVFGDPQVRHYRLVEKRGLEYSPLESLDDFGSQPIPISAETIKDCRGMVETLSRENENFRPYDASESMLNRRSLIKVSIRASEPQLRYCFSG